MEKAQILAFLFYYLNIVRIFVLINNYLYVRENHMYQKGLGKP